jgi:hypothetical protein
MDRSKTKTRIKTTIGDRFKTRIRNRAGLKARIN